MPNYQIWESVGRNSQRVTNYADLERHHPSSGNEPGRVYGTVNGEREELRGSGGRAVRTADGDYFVSKDFVLQTSADRRHAMVPAVANGYVDGIDARGGVLQIWDKPAGAPDREMIAQYRHMDLTRTSLRNGDTVAYGQPLAPQSGYGGGKATTYGSHVHLDMNASYLPTLDRYLKDLHGGRITTDSYPRDQVNLSTPARVEDISAKGSITAGTGSRAPMADGMLVKGESGEEVRRLQVALAGLGYTGRDGKPLVPDRDFGDNTHFAVQAFQRDHNLDDDGKAGFNTLRAINTEVANRSRATTPTESTAPPVARTGDTKAEFIASLAPAADRVARETGMSKGLILAQAALETGWGEKVLPGTNNIFNIKADAGWTGPSKTFNVPEYVNGRIVHSDEKFRVYGSIEESLRDRVDFLRDNPRYAKAGLFDEGVKGDLVKEANALQKAGYATDPKYAQKLAQIYDGPTMRRGLALAQQRDGQQAEAPAQAPAQGSVLSSGAQGDAVIRLQQQLGTLGYTGKDGKPLAPDGGFGANTRHALESFQKAHGLEPDGKAGKDVQAELDKARTRPLISEATHAGHDLYAAIGRQLPAGTQPNVVANVALQAMENGIARPSDLRAISMQGSDAVVVGNTPGFHTRVDLQAPTPTLQAMSDHLTCQATLAQQTQREQEQQANRQPSPMPQ